MNDKKMFEIGKHRIELIVPDDSRDLSYSSGDNINAYDECGQLLWNIAELLRTYSDKRGLKYYGDMYFGIRLLGDEKIFCIGFINHCEIDLNAGCITKIVNTR